MPPLKFLTPSAAIATFGELYEPADHHLTGAAQPEGHGSIFHEEGRLLACVARHRGGPVLEVGSQLGISTRYILDGLGDKGWVDAVDCNHQWDARSYSDRIRQHHCRSENYKPTERYNWAFIDGDHSYIAVTRDITLAVNAGAQLLVFHDGATCVQNDVDVGVLKAVLEYPWPQGWSCYAVSTLCGVMIAAAD